MSRSEILFPGTEDILAKVSAVVERAWKESMAPRMGNPADAGFIGWRTQLSDPFPTTWPSSGQALAFYAFARGMSLRALRDSELVGPTWARITFSPRDGKTELMLLDLRLESHGVQGVRPLRQEEIELLELNPLDALLGSRTTTEDGKLKAYYCLQCSLGNIPAEAVAAHAAFFEWLGCES